MKHDEPMTRDDALQRLGGTATRAAYLIGVTPQAIVMWPEVLTPRLRDRVQAALYRELMAARASRSGRKPAARGNITTP
jgi:hypothetical protein